MCDLKLHEGKWTKNGCKWLRYTKVDFSSWASPISNFSLILAKSKCGKCSFKLRDESKEVAFASQTAQIKKLDHSHDALQYRSFLQCGQMLLAK